MPWQNAGATLGEQPPDQDIVPRGTDNIQDVTAPEARDGDKSGCQTEASQHNECPRPAAVSAG